MDCACCADKFCKKCYSNCYYLLNRDKILEYQKDRYENSKRPSGGITIIRKPITLYFH